VSSLSPLVLDCINASSDKKNMPSASAPSARYAEGAYQKEEEKGDGEPHSYLI